MDFPILHNERIILKQLTPENKADVLRHFANEEVNKYVDFDRIGSLEEAAEIITWANSLFKNQTGILWGIFRNPDNTFMGQVNYVVKADDNFTGQKHRAEIGFDLSPDFWGNGYMTSALELTNNYVFNEMKINRIEAIVHPQNKRAHTTLEKLGFQREGRLREYVFYKNDFWDMILFSLLKKDRQ